MIHWDLVLTLIVGLFIWTAALEVIRIVARYVLPYSNQMLRQIVAENAPQVSPFVDEILTETEERVPKMPPVTGSEQ